jgi:hypothetical protein
MVLHFLDVNHRAAVIFMMLVISDHLVTILYIVLAVMTVTILAVLLPRKDTGWIESQVKQ